MGHIEGVERRPRATTARSRVLVAALGASFVLACAAAPAPTPVPRSARPATIDHAPVGYTEAELIAAYGLPPALRDDGDIARTWTVSASELSEIATAVETPDGSGSEPYDAVGAMPIGDWGPLLVSAFEVTFAGDAGRYVTVSTLVGRDRPVGDALLAAYRVRFDELSRYRPAARAIPTVVRTLANVEASSAYDVGVVHEPRDDGRTLGPAYEITGRALLVRGWSSIVLLTSDPDTPLEVLCRVAELEFSRLPENQ